MTTKDKGIFEYREKRRRQWKIEKTSTMLAEGEWNEQCDQERLVKLQKESERANQRVQRDFEDLLDSTLRICSTAPRTITQAMALPGKDVIIRVASRIQLSLSSLLR